MVVDDALLDAYAALFPASRPKTEEEKAASQELSAKRKAFVAAAAVKLGIEKPGTLQREMDKALKKREKKLEKAQAPPKAPKKKVDAPKEASNASAATTSGEEGENGMDLDEQMRRTLLAPQENHGRGAFYVNSDETLKTHLAATGGKWQLRFPPEPNGWLHIGHAKAMSVNFGIAKANDGNCYLRFDDTNPEAEKQEYIDGILENVKWLGHEPFKVTYTSDYFDQLHELAKELIRRGKAYVCRLTGEQVKGQRDAIRAYNTAVAAGEQVEFPTKEVFDEGRDVLTPEQNLELFEKMRQGRFAEGEATLRMKGDFTSKNPNMWDHMAYRVMFKEHPRTGNKWCIYPTYDYSHCLVDSIENVTHSLCTLEFETRQAPDSSYHWLLDALDMYHPKTWESSRCSLSYNVMSKRRLHALVKDSYVSGWDDPRLLTLAGLRRRGYTPTAINAFCRRIGIARSSNEVCVPINVLESCIRAELDHDAERRLAVLNPVKVVISNYDDEEAKVPRVVTVPNHPAKGREDMGSREVPLTSTLYIPAEKFRLEMVKGYKGMVPGSPKNNSVRLLNALVVTYVSHTIAADGSIAELVVKAEPPSFVAKGLSVVTWVPEGSMRAEARIYNRLFQNCTVDGVEVHAEKAAKDQGVDFTALINPDSLTSTEILIEPGVAKELEGNRRWQFITIGYFCTDSVDTTKEKPVFNLIVSLKEDKDKQ